MRPLEEMHVVRRHQPHAEFPRQRRQHRVAALLRLDAVIVQLQEEILLAQDLHESVERLPRFLRLVGQDALVDLPLQARAHADKALAVLRQHLLVDARLVVHAIQVGDGDELHQVAVARLILRQQREMVGGIPRGGGVLFRELAGGHVDLAADDRLDPGLLRLLVELDGAEEVAMVGHGDRRHAELARLAHDLRDAVGPVQHGVLRVQVEMDERVGSHEKCNIGPALGKFENRIAPAAKIRRPHASSRA